MRSRRCKDCINNYAHLLIFQNKHIRIFYVRLLPSTYILFHGSYHSFHHDGTVICYHFHNFVTEKK